MAHPQKPRLEETDDLLGDDASEDAPDTAAEDTSKFAQAEAIGEDPAEFQNALEAALTDCYPELLKRVSSAKFADWHRQCKTQIDLAHVAMLSVMKSLLKTRSLPNNLLAYLVTTAENLAKKDWLKRETDPLTNTASDPSRVKLDREEWQAGVEASSAARVSLMLGRELLSPAEEDTAEEVQDPFLDQVRLLIEKLPKRQRQVLKSYLEKGTYQTYREIAAGQHISEDNFQHALDRAGRSLCKLLKARGLDVPAKITWKIVRSKSPISIKGNKK